jgi:hypothetical protein
MGFFLGLILFIIVLGRLDRRLPWPDPHRSTSNRR